MSVDKPNNLAIDQRVTITLSGLSNQRAKKQKLLFLNQFVPKCHDIVNTYASTQQRIINGTIRISEVSRTISCEEV